MLLKEVTNFLEKWAPLSHQASYDNSGLLLGDADDKISGALITLDITEEVINEAIAKKCNLIIAHHPLIFQGIKQIGKTHWQHKCIRMAIKHDIAIYAIHTNLDFVHTGVNSEICKRLSLERVEILDQSRDSLYHLSFFVPSSSSETVKNELHNIGAGKIGNYDHCSFASSGQGTFRGNDESSPTIGQKEQKENVQEDKVEMLIPAHLTVTAIHTLKTHHPYEEVAYFLEPIHNTNQEVGAGMVGRLSQPMKIADCVDYIKEKMNLKIVKCTIFHKSTIRKIAVCGGSGASLLSKAIHSGADMFVSSDFKYHDFFEANGKITVLDIGHYESEVFTKDLLYDALSKNFTRFAFHLSQVDTNPIKYL